MLRKHGKGSQKQARFERLANEVRKFVYANPGCSAQAIVASLNHDQKMRNHGLTPRKSVSSSLATSVTRWCGGKTIAPVAGFTALPLKAKNNLRSALFMRFAHVGSVF